MSERDEIITEKVAGNTAEFMENGPRLTTRYGVWVEAKDTTTGMVYLAGLGCMGVGRMWSRASGWEDDPTYAEAPESTCPDDIVRSWRDAEKSL